MSYLSTYSLRYGLVHCFPQNRWLVVQDFTPAGAFSVVLLMPVRDGEARMQVRRARWDHDLRDAAFLTPPHPELTGAPVGDTGEEGWSWDLAWEPPMRDLEALAFFRIVSRGSDFAD